MASIFQLLYYAFHAVLILAHLLRRLRGPLRRAWQRIRKQ